jgi:hypothetical protein
VARQSLHTDAGNDQVDLECGGGDLRGFVAAEHIWTIPFIFPDPHWDVSKLDWAIARWHIREHDMEAAGGLFLTGYKKQGANNAWNSIGSDLDSRVRGRAPAMVA